MKRVSRKQEFPSCGLSQPALAAKCQLMGWDIGCDTIEGQTRLVGDAEFVHLAHTFAVPLGALFSQRDPANFAAYRQVLLGAPHPRPRHVFRAW